MKSNVKKPQFLESLLAKYRADPERFRAYLPEVAQTLDAMYPALRSPRSPFGLTEQERAYRRQALRRILEHLEQGHVLPEEAGKGLEHCATLIDDDSLPPDVSQDTLARLLRAAIGKSPGSVKANTTIPMLDSQEDKVVNRISVVRGVVLNLTWDMRLVSITITPRKFKERHKALRFVGAARDVASDVALRHDDHLAAGVPHAAP